MKPLYVKRAAVAISALSYVAASLALFAQATPTTAPNVTYSATGTFASTPVAGQDIFKLAGNPFTINIVANEANVPATHGARWAKYTKLTMSGAVTSTLIPIPFAISSPNSSIELAMGNPAYNVFAMFTPINVLGKLIYIKTNLQMPAGTLTTPLIKPFAGPVTLGPSSGTVSYSDPSTGTATTLAIANGTLSALVSR
jgi:hypothetical protein